MATTLFWTSVFSLPLSAIGAGFYWQPICWQHLVWVLASAVCILVYNGLAVMAYQRAPADRISMAEYTGLIFVTLMGIAWFDEIPDVLSVMGMILIILPLLPWRKFGRRTEAVSAESG